MRQKSKGKQTASEKLVKDIRRKTRKQYSAEEKIRIVLDGLRAESSIAELCRCEGIAEYMRNEIFRALFCPKLRQMDFKGMINR